jgi:sugar phosphate isomerase/epimerase
MYMQRWPGSAGPARFVDVARRLGFDGVEIGHVVRSEDLARFDPRDLAVVAVHHPCPSVPGGPGATNLLAADPDHRRRAADLVLQSLRTAEALGAGALVVHLGHLDGAEGETVRRLAFELRSRYQAGERRTARYEAVRTALVGLLEEWEPARIEIAEDVLAPLLAEASRVGVRMGIETMADAVDLPRPAGFGRLLRSLGGAGLRGWLDTGHVGAQENLGLLTLADWNEAVGGAWLGAHLHDVVGVRDHLVPGRGQLDFAPAAIALPADAVLTLEVDWYFDPDELATGKAFIEARVTG